jgi:hypothetical protein
MRSGMSPSQLWRDYVRMTMAVFKEAGVASNQYGDANAYNLDKAA